MTTKLLVRWVLPAVLVTMAGGCSDDGEGLSCPADMVKRAGVCRSRNGSVSGTLTLGSGAAPAGATVALLGTDRMAAVDANGAYLLREVVPGTYTLEARAPGHGAVRREVVVGEEEPVQVPALELPPLPALELRGKLTLADGGDPAGALVSLLDAPVATPAAADGSFHLPVSGPGKYTVVARLSGYLEARVADVEVKDGPVELAPIQLTPATGGVAGKIRIGDGTTGHGDTAVFLEGTGHLAYTADDGAFSLLRIDPGEHVLVAMREGFATGRASVTIAAGEVAHLADLVLEPAAPAGVGTIVGAAQLLGETIHEGIAVRLEGGPGIDRTATTGANGSYAFDEVPAGAYRLTFRRAPFADRVVEGLVVEAGELAPPVVTLRRSVPLAPKPLDWATALGADDFLARFVGAYEPVFRFAPEDGTWTQLLPGEASHLATSPDGAFALFAELDELVRVELATGERVPVAPRPTELLLVTGDGVWYRTADGDLWYAAADGIDGIRAFDAPCANQRYFTYVLAQGAALAQREGYCNGGTSSTLVLLPGTAAAVEIQDLFLFDGDRALVRLRDDVSATYRVARISFADGTVTPLVENVGSVSTVPDTSLLRVLHSVASGTRLSVIGEDGTAVPVLDQVQYFLDDAAGGFALYVAGPNQSIHAVNFPEARATLACANADAYWLTLEPGFFCREAGSGVPRLLWFDFEEEDRRQVAVGNDYPYLLGYGASVIWTDDDGSVYGATRSTDFTERRLGPAHGVQVLASTADGTRLLRLALESNMLDVSVIDLVTGETKGMFAGPQEYTQGHALRCAMAPDGGTAFCSYSWGNPGPWQCPEASCVAAIDVATDQRSLTPAPALPDYPSEIVWSPDRRSALLLAGGQTFFLGRGPSGAAVLREGPYVGTVSLAGVGNGGLHGVIYWDDWYGPRYFKVSAGAWSPESLGYEQVHSIDAGTWVVGDRLHFLADNTVVDLIPGVGQVVPAPAGGAFLFVAGPEGDLYRWSEATGVKLVASRAVERFVGTERLWVTERQWGAGVLERIDPSTGDRTTLLDGFVGTVGAMADGRHVMLAHFDPHTYTGSLVAIDLPDPAAAEVLATDVRETFPIGGRIVFRASAGEEVRALDPATGQSVKLGRGEFQRYYEHAPTGRRFVEAGGIWWVEGRDGAGPMAIDFAAGWRPEAIAPDGGFVLYGGPEGTFGLGL